MRAAAAAGATKAVETTANGLPVKVFNEGGDKRVVVTKDLPGQRWIDVLVKAGCRVEVCTHPQVILDNAKIKQLMGPKVDGVIGQLTGMSPSAIAQASIQGVHPGNDAVVDPQRASHRIASLTRVDGVLSISPPRSHRSLVRKCDMQRTGRTSCLVRSRRRVARCSATTPSATTTSTCRCDPTPAHAAGVRWGAGAC